MKFITTCCPFSKDQLEHWCVQHGDDCPDTLLAWRPAWNEVPERFILRAENAVYEAKYCPSCGKQLDLFCIPDKENTR